MRLVVGLALVGLGIWGYKKWQRDLREAKEREEWMAQQQRQREEEEALYGLWN